jgi:SRSO17 transposase
MPHPAAARETTQAEVTQWAQELTDIARRIGPRFSRAEPRRRALQYLRGLLSPLERKNGWQLAEQVGDTTPYGVQHLLGRAQWDAEAVRDDLRQYVVTHLGGQEAIFILDETGFLKKGIKSVGVARQYSGAAGGRIANCQVGVFLAYVSAKGQTFLDRELYLPQAWAENPTRRRAAGVPEEVRFATKSQLAQRMLARARAHRVPGRWVTGDAVYGSDSALRGWLEEHHLYYILAVTAQYRIWTGAKREWAAAIIKRLPPTAWRRYSAGWGSKGARLYEWTRLVVRKGSARRRRWLVARRRLSDPTDLTYYIASGPPRTSLPALVRVAGARWAIEESFETAKGEVGLDQYEVRSWSGWYRHVTLALLAHAYLTVTRARAAIGPLLKKSLASPATPSCDLAPAHRP